MCVCLCTCTLNVALCLPPRTLPLPRDGWDLLLAQALILLRDVAHRLKMPQEHIAYTLELSVILATLPKYYADALSAATGCGPLPDPQTLCGGAMQALVTGVSDIMRASIIKGGSSEKWVVRPRLWACCGASCVHFYVLEGMGKGDACGCMFYHGLGYVGVHGLAWDVETPSIWVNAHVPNLSSHASLLRHALLCCCPRGVEGAQDKEGTQPQHPRTFTFNVRAPGVLDQGVVQDVGRAAAVS